MDIGSSNIRTIIAQVFDQEEAPRIIGVGVASSSGMRRGSIIDIEGVSKSIEESMEKSERMAGLNIRKGTISISGTEIAFQNSKGVVAVGRADGEVTEDDINRVISEAQAIQIPLNKEIIHIIPRSYRLDDQENIKDPVGMTGVRLEADALVIEDSASHIKNLTKCAYQAGMEVEDMVLAPLAAAKSVLSKKQKELGVVLVDIGGGTTKIAVFEEGDLLHMAIIPIGASHITNDIAIGLRTSIETAEKVKLECGSALVREIGKKEEIDLSDIDSQEEGIVSRYHIAEIIEARLEEILTLVNKELKAIHKNGLLPAGVVLTGGGAKLPHIVEITKDILGLPAQVGFPSGFGGMLDKVDDPSFATVMGLIIWTNENNASPRKSFYGMRMVGNISRGAGGSINKIKGWLGKFLP